MEALLLISSAQKLPRFVVRNETKGAELIGEKMVGRFCETPNERNGVGRGYKTYSSPAVLFFALVTPRPWTLPKRESTEPSTSGEHCSCRRPRRHVISHKLDGLKPSSFGSLDNVLSRHREGNTAGFGRDNSVFRERSARGGAPPLSWLDWRSADRRWRWSLERDGIFRRPLGVQHIERQAWWSRRIH